MCELVEVKVLSYLCRSVVSSSYSSVWSCILYHSSNILLTWPAKGCTIDIKRVKVRHIMSHALGKNDRLRPTRQGYQRVFLPPFPVGFCGSLSGNCKNTCGFTLWDWYNNIMESICIPVDQAWKFAGDICWTTL
jgi:hypothetical protein